MEVWLEGYKGPPPPTALVGLIREVGLSKRRRGSHSEVCSSCAGLSAAVPVYVRRCELQPWEEDEGCIAWADFVLSPGREFLVFFQRALDNLSSQQQVD